MEGNIGIFADFRQNHLFSAGDTNTVLENDRFDNPESRERVRLSSCGIISIWDSELVILDWWVPGEKLGKMSLVLNLVAVVYADASKTVRTIAARKRDRGV